MPYLSPTTQVRFPTLLPISSPHMHIAVPVESETTFYMHPEKNVWESVDTHLTRWTVGRTLNHLLPARMEAGMPQQAQKASRAKQH